ncbi:MAG: PQQ-binding-like beta-propeller repeat protein [Verrucomicrobiota bacterium]
MRNSAASLGVIFALVGSFTIHAEENRLTFHAEPKSLPPHAHTEDWPRFLGPRDDATSAETGILDSWPDNGPAKVWEVTKGEGYAGPSIAGDRLVMFHREGGEEVVECREPETGKLLWAHCYGADYDDSYGFSNGPRANPVIDDEFVFTAGVTGVVKAFEIADGKERWSLNLRERYRLPQNFFGYGASPLVWEDLVLLNTGGEGDDEGSPGVCVAAFNRETGEEVWTATDKWGASYASPIIMTIHGREILFVFAGGQSRPPHGGLLALDPKTGEVLSRFPWRADKYESVNASTPLDVGNNRLFISECYEKGGVLLEFDENIQPSVVWEERWFGMHWTSPILNDGVLYGFAGRNEPDVQFKAADAITGEILWEDEMRWTEKSGDRDLVRGLFRAWLLKVGDRHLAWGEHGALALLELSREGPRITQRHQLFLADHSWTPLTLSRGLLYVTQNNRDRASGADPRIICYDLRATSDDEAAK